MRDVKSYKKLRNKYRRLWTKKERHTRRFRELKEEYPLELLIEEAKKMELWCASKKDRKPTLKTFNNWMKNYTKWKKEKEERCFETLEERERKKTKEFLEKYGANKSDNSK